MNRVAATVIVVMLAMLASEGATAQTFIDGEDEIPASALTLDVESSPSRYAGEYHFGFSEGESTLKITVKGGSVTGTLTYGEWDERTNGWKSRTLTFKGRIVGGMLVADKWYGVFVRHGKTRGLVFHEAPSDHVDRSFGYRME